jgi:uncharacterized protein
MASEDTPYTAFSGVERIASGQLADVAARTKAYMDREPAANVLIFEDATAKQIEVDFRGDPDEVRGRIEESVAPASPEDGASRGPGRPKLGVIGREVTLLPRHWDWLNAQPGGASVALRKLVENARRENADQDRIRESRGSTLRFMTTMAGNLPGYEEASRALFAGDAAQFQACTQGWPADLRDHARKMAEGAF